MKTVSTSPDPEHDFDYCVGVVCTCGEEALAVAGSHDILTVKQHTIKIDEDTLEGNVDLECLSCGRTYHIKVNVTETDECATEVTDTTKYIYKVMPKMEGSTLAILVPNPIAPNVDMPVYRVYTAHGDNGNTGVASEVEDRLKQLQDDGFRPILVRVIEPKLTVDLRD